MTEFMNDYIDRSWNYDASKRTLLYYLFLLARDGIRKKDKANRNSKLLLKDMASIESGDFDEILNEFRFYGVIVSVETAELAPNAVVRIEERLIHDLGGTDPVALDGLEIFRANSKKRFALWVENGTEYIKQIFADVSNISFRQISYGRERGQLLILETDIHQPFVVVYFINTRRMKQMSELEPLFSCAQMVLSERMRVVEDSQVTPEIDTFKAITIAAAPTYSNSTAHEAAHSQLPTRLLGPINLAILGHYLTHDRPCCRTEQYEGLLKFLDPSHGGMHGGIIFSTYIREYLERELRDAYRINNCYPQ